MPDSATAPAPLRLTVAVEPVVALLERVSMPEAAPTAVGLNFTASVADWPGVRVIGNVAPDTAKPGPLTLAELTVTGTLPVDITETDCVAELLTITLPKETLAALRPMLAAFSCRGNDCVVPFSDAVSVAVCAVATAVAVNVKDALDAPA
jgi:hypothetical protein